MYNSGAKRLKDRKGTGKNCRMGSLIFCTLRQIKVLWLANKGLWESREKRWEMLTKFKQEKKVKERNHMGKGGMLEG
jgi:hypothetical protein